MENVTQANTTVIYHESRARKQSAMVIPSKNWLQQKQQANNGGRYNNKKMAIT